MPHYKSPILFQLLLSMVVVQRIIELSNSLFYIQEGRQWIAISSIKGDQGYNRYNSK